MEPTGAPRGAATVRPVAEPVRAEIAKRSGVLTASTALVTLLAAGWFGCIVGPKQDDPASASIVPTVSDASTDTAAGGTDDDASGPKTNGDAGAFDAALGTPDAPSYADASPGDTAPSADGGADVDATDAIGPETPDEIGVGDASAESTPADGPLD